MSARPIPVWGALDWRQGAQGGLHSIPPSAPGSPQASGVLHPLLPPSSPGTRKGPLGSGWEEGQREPVRLKRRALGVASGALPCALLATHPPLALALRDAADATELTADLKVVLK